MTTLLTSFFSLLNLGLLFYYSWSLALVALAVAVITSVLTIIAGTIARQKFRSLQELSGEIVGLMVETIDGISKLRVAAAADRAFARWAKKYSQQVQLILSTQRVEDFLALLNTVMPGAASMLLFSLAVVAIAQSQGELMGACQRGGLWLSMPLLAPLSAAPPVSAIL